MRWRTQKTLVIWLSLVTLLLAGPHGIRELLGQRRVNIDRVARGPGVAIRFVTDVNRAPCPELTLLPRIGPAIAQRIVESREKEGPFRAPEDLLRVRGIGPKTLAAIRPYLSFTEH